MSFAIACLEQEYLGVGVLFWEQRKVIRAEKIAD